MQAIIITCYKDQKNLERIIKCFNSNDFKIYVHIDKKSSISINELMNKHPNAIFLKNYNISWGGYNHILAVNDLLKLALKDNCNYYHIISGQDLPIISKKDFIKKFKNNKQIYMTCTSNFSKDILNRAKYKILNSNYNLHNYLVKIINKLYGITHNKKIQIGPFTKLYKGMIWCSFSKEICEYVLEFNSKDSSYLKDLIHIKIPEEFYFQTIIMNSKYADNVVCDNLRYTDWTFRNGNSPAYLDISDYDKVVNSDCVFCRKIDSNISKELIEKILKM